MGAGAAEGGEAGSGDLRAAQPYSTHSEQSTAGCELVGSVVPRLWTPSLGGRTLGPSVAAFATLIGMPLLPWQRWLFDHALELRDDGRFRYRTIVILIARQNGKTVVLRIRALAGLYLLGERLIIGTAQNRDIALESWRGAVSSIKGSARLVAELETVTKTNGKEELALCNGARYKIVAPTADGPRGLAGVDLVMLDELREHHTWAAWSALDKTRRARTNSQLWGVSNAGDLDSVVLAELRRQGQAAALDPASDPSLGYFEWSAPDGCEIGERSGWAAANPSLGHLLEAETLAAEALRDPEPVFRTEALCQWVRHLDDWLPDGAWERCGDDDALGVLEGAAPRAPYVALDITPDRKDAVLLAAVPLAAEDEGAGRFAAGVVAAWSDPRGIDEDVVIAESSELAGRLGAGTLGYDRRTCAAAAEAIAAACPGLAAADITGERFARACTDLYDAITNRRLVHNGDRYLAAHVAAAVRRPSGDGWRLSRRHSSAPICGAVAAAHLAHLVRNPPLTPVLITR